MEMSVQIKTNWPTVWIFTVAVVPIGVVLYLVKEVTVELFLVVVAVCVLLICLLLYLIQSGTEIAKKALELEVELAKKEAEDAKRKEEDKKSEDAAQKNREHEIKLAEITSAVRVEVTNVRLL